MTAAEKLNTLAREFARQKDIVGEECRRMESAAALMKKWGESRLVDAVSREAKSRAIKALGA